MSGYVRRDPDGSAEAESRALNRDCDAAALDAREDRLMSAATGRPRRGLGPIEPRHNRGPCSVPGCWCGR